MDGQQKISLAKGQLISKANCQAVNSSKKQTNEFVFTSMRRIFVRFLEEIEDTKKTFRNYLTFKMKIKKNQVESVFPALIKLSTNLAMKSKWGPFIKI